MLIPLSALLADADNSIDRTLAAGIKDSFQLAVSETDSTEYKEIGSTAFVVNSSAMITTYQLDSKGSGPNASDDPMEESLDPLIAKYAGMISVDPQEINNYPLYRFIDQWYGIPYKWGGDDNTGIDCSAFSQKLYGSVFRVEIDRTARQQHRSAERIKDPENAAEGDLVFFRMHHVRVSHVGVYLANGYFVHASRSQGVVISNLSSKYWHRRYAGCGRVEKEDKGAYETGSSLQ